MSGIARLAGAVDALGVPRWLPKQGPLLLMYHGLGGVDGVDPRGFDEQLALLQETRRVVSLAEAVASLGRPESATLAAITFDDGYTDFADLALPVLRQRGLPATLFVPTAWVGANNAWDAGRAPERALLTVEDLRRLDPALVEIGAHSHTHCRLVGLVPERLAEETLGARQRLEAWLDRQVRFFAFPYGQLDDFDEAATAAVEAAGFDAACSTHFGRGSRPGERFRLRRVGIGAGETLIDVARKLEGAYDWVPWKERLGAAARRLRRGRGGAR